MAQLTLEVLQKQYQWKLPRSDEPKVHELKDHIGDRCKGDVLYHTKLKFSSSGKTLMDEDTVPLAPAVVQVAGPASVVQMFRLFCDRDGKPLPKAKPAPRPVVTAPVQQRSPALGGYGGSAQPQDMLMLTNSWTPPTWNQSAQEDQDLNEALAASRAAFQADEEAQLRWALEESALLAEQEEHEREENAQIAAQEEEIKKFYMQDMQKKSKGSATSSTTARAEAALQELESDEEGVAWDSDSHKESHKDDLDEGSDSDDEGPPPLELLPDSEE